MQKALTDKTIEALKPGPKRYDVNDLRCPGLQLRVSPSGHKAFYAKFRYGLKQKHPKLGVYPRSFKEELGDSYFDYLSKQQDLVMLMDESHRYRATAGMRAINELNPVMGLELTATPFVEGSKGPVPFRNVVFDYPLARAMEDGFVKDPAVVTRKNFIAAGKTPASIEQIKLEDGIRLHERVKVDLETYARENDETIVKPFVLVIARDTSHAAELMKLIKSDVFFGGNYAEKVIQVDSSVKEEETIEKLLTVEHADNPVEIVIHVNMLKEGWDVTNLYTIVPLRAANARTLIEQSIGRGLRLPYGKRTGVAAVDRLNIVAHDRFQEIVDEANNPKSPIRLRTLVLDEEILEHKKVTVVATPTILARLGLPSGQGDEGAKYAGAQPKPKFEDTETQRVAQLTYEAIRKLSRDPSVVPDISYLTRPDVQEKLVREVRSQYRPQQMELEGVAPPPPDFAKIAAETSSEVINQTISIPRISLMPKGEVKAGFRPFKLDLSTMNLVAPDGALLARYLDRNEADTIGVIQGNFLEKTPEDYVVSGLINFPDVSYDDNADLLYDLAGQVLKHLRSRMEHNELMALLQAEQDAIARAVRAQMLNHYWIDDTVEYEAVVKQGFTEIRSSAHTSEKTEPLDYRSPPADKSNMARYLFGGYSKCLLTPVRFQSDTERKLSVILERESLKWFKPAKGQFQMFYRDGSDHQEYIPDFVAETETEILMLEPKMATKMQDSDVLAKRDVATKWCQQASEHGMSHGGNATTGGFEMLATFDSNTDGIISASDTVFAELKVWIDANADGVTDDGELKSLDELGIVSISLAHVAPASPLQIEGNNVARTSTFTLASGQTRAIGDVTFGVSAVNTKYLGDSNVSASAAALPELKGYGRVKNLRVAMTQDAGLQTQVADFAALTTTDLSVLREAAEDILYAWAGVAGVTATALGSNGFDTRKLAFLEAFSGIELLPRDEQGVIDLDALGSVEQQWTDNLARLTLRLVAQGPLAAAFTEVAYNADWDLLLSESPTALADILHRVISALPTSDHTTAAAALAEWAPVLKGLSETMLRADANIVRSDYLFSQLLRALDDVMTPLSLAEIAAALGVTNLQIGSSGNDTQTRAGDGTAIYFSGGGTDTITGGTGQDVTVFGRVIGHATITDVEAYENGDRIRFAFLNPSDVTMARSGNDLLITVTATGETVRVIGQFAPVVAITAGVFASPNRGIEDIQFADGTIWEEPEIMTAVGTGTDGDDLMIGTMHSDVFIGGKGNDRMEGGDDADLYVVRAGDGQDVVVEQQTTVNLRAVDMMVFGDGLAPEDIVFARDDDDLIISTGGSNSVRIENQFGYGVLGYNSRYALNSRVEAFAFKDYADSWTSKQIQQVLIEQETTDGNDTTRGFGDDDYFEASSGNDTLIGLDGQDTYRWGKGAGNDIIDERALYIDIDVGMSGLNLGLSADTIEFAEDVSLDNLVFTRLSDAPDLTIRLIDTNETLTVKNQFGGFQSGPLGAQWFDRVEWFKFADGTSLSWQDILLKVTTGGAGNDSLYGDLWQDTLTGNGGNDFLSGKGYSDTYKFNVGDGQDTIQDGNNFLLGQGLVQLDEDPDTLLFGAGIDPDDIGFEHVGNDIKLIVGTNGDSVLLKGQDSYIQTGVFGAISWDRVEKVKFADGTIWTWDELQQRVIAAQTTAGNDSIRGFTLEDHFAASAGDDVLMGGDSSDTYDFAIGSGDDQVRDEVSNVLYGDEDKIAFGAGITTSNIVLARDGADLLVSIAGESDTLRVVGQFENYVRFTFKQIEKFEFADGTIWTAIDVQDRLLQSTTGNDVLTGYFTDDTLAGGLGNDTLRGGDGADTYLFNLGDGQDRIEESVQYVSIGDDDVLRFGAGISPTDLVFSRTGNDLTIGIAGTTDQITIAGQWEYYVGFTNNDIERFEFADGTIWTKDQIAAQMLASTPGDDLLIGTSYNDRLDGGAGNDRLEGGDGSDTYVFGRGYGQDVVRESVASVSIGDDDGLIFKAGIAPSDLIYTRENDDLIISISGTSDSVRIEGQFALDAWFTWHDIERFEFADGTVLDKATIRQMVLAGTAGDDHIIGFASDDTLDGGAGNDILEGGDGADTYRFGTGDGQDLIREGLYDGRLSEDDTLSFKTGVLPADVAVTRVGQDAIFTLASGDNIRVEGQFVEGYNELLSSNDVEHVVFADGTTWDKIEIDRRSINATSGDDVLLGSRYAQTYNGLGGNDTIYAGDRDDILIGGTGNDRLEGQGGDDTYKYNIGDGDDVILDEEYFGNGTNKIVFGPGIAAADLRLTGNAADGTEMTIGFVNRAGSIRVLNQWIEDTGIETFEFADGTSWTLAQIAAAFAAGQATSGNDTLYGTNFADVLVGGTGDDSLVGGSGDDIYRFARGDGQDVVRDFHDGDNGRGGLDAIEFGATILPSDVTVALGDSDHDIVLTINGTSDRITIDETIVDGDQRIEEVRFTNGVTWSFADMLALASPSSDGNDTITGTESGETLSGGGGNDLIDAKGGDDTVNGDAGNDILIAGSGNDIVVGGSGNDTLYGLSGDDIYRFASGAGQDIIREVNPDIWDWGGNDTVEFASGIAPADIVVTQARDGKDIVLTNTVTGDVVTISDTMNDWRNRVEQVKFADNTIWNHAQLVQMSTASNSGNNVFYGTYDGETLSGGAGNDTLNTMQGNDVLVGGTGNDTLYGLSGDDTYRFSAGDGQDIVREVNPDIWDWGGNDTIEFTAGVTPSDIVVTQVRDGRDLVLTNTVTGDTITISDTMNDWRNRVEQVRFADNTIWNHAQLVQMSTAANSGNNVFYGTYDSETLDGGAGNDTLNALAGNDILIGGAGNDILYGLSGDDVFRFAAGDGQDIVREVNPDIWDWGGNDTIEFVSGIAPADIAVSQARDGRDLILTNNVTGDTVTIADTMNDWRFRVEQVKFADNTIWNHAQLVQMSMAANTGADNFYGTYDNDTLDGGAGNDVIDARDGDDRIIGGSGNDALTGGWGSDVAVYAGVQADYSLATSNGTTTITDNQAGIDGNDGTDTLVGIEKAEFKGGVQVGIGAPVVLDLNGDGVRLINRSVSSVTFDWEGQGIRRRTGWVDVNDGILVIDRNGDGTVSGANEISFTGDKPGARSDLDGLTAFDSDGDGKLSSSDARFADFRIWQDANANGVSDQGELQSLTDRGIDSIALAGQAVNRTWGWGENLTVNTASYSRTDGTFGALSDVALIYDIPTSGARPASSNAVIDPAHMPYNRRQAALEAFGNLPTLADRWRVRDDQRQPFTAGRGERRISADAFSQAEQLAQAMASFGTVGAFDAGGFVQADRPDFDRMATIDRTRAARLFDERYELV